MLWDAGARWITPWSRERVRFFSRKNGFSMSVNSVAGRQNRVSLERYGLRPIDAAPRRSKIRAEAPRGMGRRMEERRGRLKDDDDDASSKKGNSVPVTSIGFLALKGSPRSLKPIKYFSNIHPCLSSSASTFTSRRPSWRIFTLFKPLSASRVPRPRLAFFTAKRAAGGSSDITFR